jgi:hypothetical protein
MEVKLSYLCCLCLAVQGHKLSRYGRQAKELVENGGEGLQVQYQQFQDGPSDPKRARYDPQSQPGVPVGVGYSTSHAQIAATGMV